MSNELGMAFGDAITGGMQAYRGDRARQDLLNRDKEQREHERNIEAVRQAIAQIQSASRERVGERTAASRDYATSAGLEGRQYAADASAGASDRRADATRYGADQGFKGRTYAADKTAGASAARDANAVKVADIRNAGNLATQGLRNKGTLASVLARPGRAGGSTDATTQRDLASARSLYGRMFGPRPQQFDGQGNPLPQQAPPKFEDWMNSGAAGRLPPSAAPAGPAGAPGGGATRPTYAPQHQQTASQMLQQIRAAEASGDVEKVKALKMQASKFLSTIQPGAGAPPQPDEQPFDDGADDGMDDGLDDEPDDDEDDQQP